jgi:ketosteroid isomerase-like protein
MRLPCIAAAIAILTGPLFAEQTDRSGWQYDAVMPDHLPDTTGTTGADVNAINDLLVQARDRWNAHDLDGYISGYWNSPQLLIVINDQQIQGWKAVNATYRNGYPDPKAMGEMQYSRIQIRITKPDLALIKTSWTANFPSSNRQLIGNSTLNVQKFNEGWKVVSEYSKYESVTSRGWEYDSITPARATTTPSEENDEIKAINDLLLGMLDRWNSHDLSGYLSVYWNSPQLLVILQEEQYQGWQSLNDAYKSGFPDPNAMGSIQPSRIQIKLIRSDLATALTWWTITYPTSKVHVVGNTTMNLQKFSNGWKVILEHSSFAEP